MRVAVWVIFAACLQAQGWKPQTSGTTASLRGISAVNTKVAWASGTKGTFLKTVDGGATWTVATMPGAADLDFRDVHAVDERTVFLMSAGPGEQSRMYKTSDAGARWQLIATNLDPKGFWDCMSFWDSDHGMLVGDPVEGRFTILSTSDGVRWQTRKGPAANKDEALFAASGTCLHTRGTREVWFATGGKGGARVFHSVDAGETWTVAKTPLRNDSEGAGGFSIAFSDARHGVVVGGDYGKAGEAALSLALTEDGGKTWVAGSGLGGYRSAVAFVGGAWIAAGTSGSDVSRDGGKTWTAVSAEKFNAMSFTPEGAGWAVGPEGRVFRWE